MTDSELFFLDKSDPASWRALNALALKVATATEDAGLPRSLVELVNVRISQLNRCAFCLDLHSRHALEAGVTPQQLAVLPAWREANVFTDRERAALAVGEAATVLADTETRLSELAAARLHLNDEEWSAVQWASIAMNAFNRVSVLSRHPVRTRASDPGEIDVEPSATMPTVGLHPSGHDAPSNSRESKEITVEDQTAITVRNNPDRQRYELLDGDTVIGTADWVPYEAAGESQRIFYHTMVDDAYSGQGLASRLASYALEDTAEAGLAVVPVCRYIGSWLRKHPEGLVGTVAVRPEHLAAVPSSNSPS